MDSLPFLSAACRGFLLSCGLVFPIGPQNLFVVRMGRDPKLRMLAGTLCAICDALLITLGLAGLGSLLRESVWTMRIFAVLGAALLFRTGCLLLRARSKGESAEAAKAPTSREVFREALGYSVLNPHAVLDTVLIIGAVGSIYPPLPRLAFGIGACLASSLWFWLLGRLGGAALASAERRGLTSWIDKMSGAILIAFSAKIAAAAFG